MLRVRATVTAILVVLGCLLCVTELPADTARASAPRPEALTAAPAPRACLPRRKPCPRPSSAARPRPAAPTQGELDARPIVAAGLGILPDPTLDRGAEPAGFAFYASDPQGRPVYWRSCEPLRTRVNLSGLSPAGRARLLDALVRVDVQARAALGHGLSIVGETDIQPWVTDRWTSAGEPDTQMLVGAADSRVTTALTGALAITGQTITQSGDQRWYERSGMLIDARMIDGPLWGTWLRDGWYMVPVNEDYLYRVLLHEFGHALGLGHTPSPGQIMGPRWGNPALGYQNGDVTGVQTAQIAALGRTCRPGAAGDTG